jgi:autotransporter-associated beta strand protein
MLAALAILGAGDGFSADKYWDGGGGDNRWQTNNNWQTNGIPDSADNAIFDNTYVGTLPTTIELRGNRSINSLTFDTADPISIVNGPGTRTLTLTSGDITRTSSSSGSQSLTFTNLDRASTGAFTFDISGAGDFTVSSIIRGTSRTLVKEGNGLLLLSASNTYTGATTVSDGILRITNTTALGTTAAGTSVTSGGELQLSGGLTISGETLSLAGAGTAGALVNQSGSNTWSANLSLSAATTIANSAAATTLTLGGSGSDHTLVNSGHTLTLAGAGDIFVNAQTSGAGGLIKTGAGTATVSFGNSSDPALSIYSGDTTVNEGTLIVDVGGTSGSPATPLTGAVTVGVSGSSTAATLETRSYQQIGDTTAVRVNQAGTLFLNGTIYTDGPFIETIGALTLEGGARVQTTDGATTATFRLNGDVTRAATGSTAAEISGRVDLGGGTRTFSVADSAADVDLLISAIISEPYYSSLTKTGAGTLSLTAANTFTGETNINAGVLRVSTASALGAANFTNTVASGAALEFDGTFTLNETGLAIAGSGISSAGALRGIGGTNGYDGQLALDAGGASIGADSGASLSLGGQINGGTFTKVGDGTLTLTGSQAVNTTAFVVTAGTTVLNRTANGNLLNTAATVSGGTLRLGASGQIADYTTVTLGSAGTLDLNNFNETVSALAMNGGSVTTGGGTLTLSSGSAVTTSASSSTASISGNLAITQFTSTFSVANGAATIDASVTATLSGSIGSLQKTGAGTLSLTGANTFSTSSAAGIDIQGGVLLVSSDSALGASTNDLTLNGGTLQLASSFTLGSSRTLTVGASGGTLDLASGITLSLATGGQLTGSGALTKTGDGTLALSGNNTLTGAFTLAGGTLAFGTGTQDFGALNVTADSILDFSGGNGVFDVDSLSVASGVTLTVVGWTNAADYFYSRIDPGATNLGRIIFAPSDPAAWDSFDSQVRPGPIPEPGSYGLLAVGSLTGFLTCRRRRRQTT